MKIQLLYYFKKKIDLVKLALDKIVREHDRGTSTQESLVRWRLLKTPFDDTFVIYAKVQVHANFLHTCKKHRCFLFRYVLFEKMMLICLHLNEYFDIVCET